MRSNFIFKMLLLGSAAIAWPAHGQSASPAPAPGRKAAAASTDIRFSTSLAAVYSDNIFGTTNYRQSDRISVFQAEGEVARKGEQGQLRLYGSSEISRYRDHPSEDTKDFAVGLDGARTLSSSASISGGIEYSQAHEDRASPDAEQGLSPTRYDRLRLHGEGELTGRLGALRYAGEFVDLDFADVTAAGGMLIDSSYRDRREFELGVRYERPGTGRRLFIQGVFDGREYGAPPLLEPGRDSRGYSALLGLRQDKEGLDWEVMAGVLGRRFQDPARHDVTGFDFGALLTLQRGGLEGTFRADRSLDETTLLGASTVLRTGAGLGVTVNPAPGWAAGLGYDADMYVYKGINRTDYVTQASLWGRRNLSPHVAVELAYQFNERNSDAAGGDFDENRFIVRLAAGLGRQPKGAWPSLPSARAALAGFYVGAFAGEQALVTGLDGVRGQGTNTSQFGATGSVTAVVAGYDVRIGQMLLGVEAESSEGDAQWIHRAERTFGAHTRGGHALDLRAGLILRDGNIVFARGGVVRTRFNTVYQLRENFTDEQRRLNGMRFGLGVEAPIGPLGSFVRAEYLHVAYPDYDVVANPKSTDNFANSEQQFRIGFGFRPFGPPPKPRTDYDFSGFYGGGFIGQSVLVSSNQGLRLGEGQSGAFLLDATRSGNGPEFGVIVGYGKALGPLYLGAELEAAVPTTNWNIDRDPTGRVYAVEKEASVAASVRAGVLVRPTALLYARVGVVRARFDNNYVTTDTSVGPEVWKRGDLVGAGVEVAATRRVRVRFDYANIRYKPYDVSYGDIPLSDTFKNEEHRFRIGALYAF